jgi:hypothetical protein
MKAACHWLRVLPWAVIALAMSGAAVPADLAARSAPPRQADAEIAVAGGHFSIGGFTLGMPGKEIKATLDRSGWTELPPVGSNANFSRNDRGGRETFTFKYAAGGVAKAISRGFAKEHLIAFDKDRDRLIARLGRADTCTGAKPASLPFGGGTVGLTAPSCTWRRQVGPECEVFLAAWDPRPGPASYSIHTYTAPCADLRVIDR